MAIENVLRKINQNLNLNIHTGKVDELYSREDLARIKKALKEDNVAFDDGVLNNWLRKPDIMTYLNGHEVCRKCKDASTCASALKGFTPLINNEGQIIYTPCMLHERQRAVFAQEKQRAAAEIPRLYKKMTFASLEDCGNTNTIKYARELSKGNVEKGLFLFGEPGIGKTHIAIATLQEWLNHDSGLFFTMPVLAGMMRTRVKDDERLTELMNSVKDVGLLVIDDFGAEKWSEFIGEKVFELLNHRYVDEKMTIITSNLSLDGLVEHMEEQGPRLASRIKGMCEVRKVGGQDRRLL